MKVLSPAKINLMLRILGQREDDYHLLQTYFQLLDWGDLMTFKTTNSSSRIKINGDFNGLPPEQNLIYKAAQLLFPYNTSNLGIEVTVKKNIPQGSGLGGGSSNAGTTLNVLNQLWKCHLTTKQLQQFAIELGADVPIFILNQSAMATGIGEELTPYPIKNYYYVLLFPKTSITTADIFTEEKLIRNDKLMPIDDINTQSNWKNTCLPIVLDKYPEVKSIYQQASLIAPIYMSGTGSTLFSCFENKLNAQRFIKQCSSKWGATLCQSKINQ